MILFNIKFLLRIGMLSSSQANVTFAPQRDSNIPSKPHPASYYVSENYIYRIRLKLLAYQVQLQIFY